MNWPGPFMMCPPGFRSSLYFHHSLFHARTVAWISYVTVGVVLLNTNPCGSWNDCINTFVFQPPEQQQSEPVWFDFKHGVHRVKEEEDNDLRFHHSDNPRHHRRGQRNHDERIDRYNRN